MKLLAKTLIIYIFFTSPLVVNAGLNPDAITNTTGDKNCGLKKDPLALPKIKTGWFKHRNKKKEDYRDSNMIPLLRENNDPVNEKRSKASFAVGRGQGVQVCPGVFLTARHNISDVDTGEMDTGFSIKSYEKFKDKEEYFPKRIKGSDQFFTYFPSENLSNLDQNWKTDFVFVKVDIKKAKNKDKPYAMDEEFENDYIPLGSFTPEYLTEHQEFTHLIRNKPGGGDKGNFFPRYNDSSYVRGNFPYLVTKPCENQPSLTFPGALATTCPAEVSASGSFMDVVKDGDHHVGGLLVKAEFKDIEFNEDDDDDKKARLKKYKAFIASRGNTMIPSSLMYKDYQDACGEHLKK